MKDFLVDVVNNGVAIKRRLSKVNKKIPNLVRKEHGL